MTSTNLIIGIRLTEARSDLKAKMAVVVIALDFREKSTVKENRTERQRFEHVHTKWICAQ